MKTRLFEAADCYLARLHVNHPAEISSLFEETNLPPRQPTKEYALKNIYVGNISFQTTEQDLDAALTGISTKAKPRAWPVSLSFTICTRSTWPYAENAASRSCSVVWNEMFPT